MIPLRQSTATTIKLGPFVDSTDGITPETGLTIQKADVWLSKAGGNMAAASADQGTSDAGAPHDELGVYDGSLNATDTDTLGPLRVDIQMSGAAPFFKEFVVLPAAVYDALVGGTDKLEVDATQWGGTAVASANVLIDGAITAAKIGSDAITAAKIQDGALTAAKFASGAFDAVWSVTTRTLSGFGTLVADIWTHTTRVLTGGTNITLGTNAIPAAALSDAAVAKIEAALLNEGDGQALIDAIVQAIDEADIDTDILPALIRDAILNRVLNGNHDTEGTVGKVLQDILTDTAEIANLNDYDGSDTPGVTTLLARLTATRAGYIDKLNVSGTLAHSDAANTYKADVSGLLTASGFAGALPDNFEALLITEDGHISRVTLVDTTTANSDMRGTDGANTTAPDNAGIAAIQEVTGKLDSTLEDDGASGYQFTELALENGPQGEGGGSGLTGANTVTITVTDADTEAAIEGATVRLTKSGSSGTQATDADGQVTFSADSATWTVAITAPGYGLFAPQSLVVDGDETRGYELTALALSNPDPNLVNLRYLVLDESGTPEDGATIYCQMIRPPEQSGFIGDTAPQIATSSGGGYVTFPVVPTATYRVSRGSTNLTRTITIPVDADDPHYADSILGLDG